MRYAGLDEGIEMNTSNDSTAAKGLLGWWASPPRPGLQRLIIPWEYRHLRVFGVTRLAGAIVATGIGAFILSYGADGRSLLAPHLPEPEPGQRPAEW